jgi:cupin superfamily acireductone dioxygenase involved in methionine salvage
MWYLIKMILLNNCKKFMAVIGVAAAWALYIFRGYQLEKERVESDNIQAELDRERQSREAEKILGGAEEEADRILDKAKHEASDIVVLQDGNKIADELNAIFDDK